MTFNSGKNFFIQDYKFQWDENILSQELPWDKQKAFNALFTKKEVKNMAASSFDLVMTAEKLAIYITDLQELATDSKVKTDERGNTIYNPETGDYERVEIPLEQRWVSLGEVKWNGEKFVVKTSATVLAKMEALNAQRARIASYEA